VFFEVAESVSKLVYVHKMRPLGMNGHEKKGSPISNLGLGRGHQVSGADFLLMLYEVAAKTKK
jgi:hypothetical protein